MKKWILILGIIMVVIGASLYAYSSFEKPKISESSFTVRGSEYISKNITVDSNDFIISITNPTSHSGLVASKNVSEIDNASILSSMAMPTYTSFGNIKEYRNIAKGNYSFIEFSTSKPATSITYGPTEYLVYIGYVGDFATTLLVIGGIVLIAGAVLNKNFKLSKF
jgi:hypothetical protein